MWLDRGCGSLWCACHQVPGVLVRLIEERASHDHYATDCHAADLPAHCPQHLQQ
jgi:hypothetical protein